MGDTRNLCRLVETGFSTYSFHANESETGYDFPNIGAKFLNCQTGLDWCEKLRRTTLRGKDFVGTGSTQPRRSVAHLIAHLTTVLYIRCSLSAHLGTYQFLHKIDPLAL